MLPVKKAGDISNVLGAIMIHDNIKFAKRDFYCFFIVSEYGISLTNSLLESYRQSSADLPLIDHTMA